MIINNTNIITPLRIIKNGSLRINNRKIVEISDTMICGDDEVLDLKGKYISPGFIDIHLHGGAGFDFMGATLEEAVKICHLHMKHGTTTLYPTTISATQDEVYKFFELYFELKKNCKNNLGGIHLEGPYLSCLQSGAHRVEYLVEPIVSQYEKMFEYAQGDVKIWSIAPELKGAMEMAVYLKNKGVLPAIAHSDSDFDTIVEAVENGFSHLTHFYSGMSSVTRKNAYRYAGVIESGYTINELTIDIIADGSHLPPSLLKMIYKLKGSDKICLITDACMGAGMPEGNYVLGGKESGRHIIVEKDVAFLPDKTSFAGSIATTDKLVRNMINLADVPLCEAVKMATLTPARIMGIDNRVGSIAVGKEADLVVFDDNIKISTVMVGGKVMYTDE